MREENAPPGGRPGGAGAGAGAGGGAGARARALAERDWAWQVRDGPEYASLVGDPGGDPGALDDLSLGAFAARGAYYRGLRAELGALEAECGGPGAAALAGNLDFAVLRDQCETWLAGEPFGGHLMPVSCMEGPQIDLLQLLSAMPRGSLRERAAVLARLRAFPAQAGQVRALLEEGLRQGRTMPRVCLEAVPGQIAAVLAGGREDPRGSAFFDAFRGELEASEAAGAAEAVEAQREQAAAAIREGVVPAFEALRHFLEETYIPGARETVACSDLPDGPAHYRQCLRFHTSTEMTPEEVHALGLREVARVRTEMEAVMGTLGRAGGAGGGGGSGGGRDLAGFFDELRRSPDFTAPSVEALLEGYRQRLADVEARLPDLFHAAPALPLEIVETPAHQAASAPAAYYFSQGVGRPGLFYVNTHDLPSRPTYQTDVLLLHEAVPGHHLQAAHACELQARGALPAFRANLEDRRYNWPPSRRPFYSAYVEGWALYCEGLGAELGLYSDPYQEFGRLSFEALRACRMVVDTGLHAFGWSQERACDYMLENSALSRLEAETEVVRYIAWPGQAVSYKVGELRIRGLRAKLEERHGGSAAWPEILRDFHETLLSNGSCPLHVFECLLDPGNFGPST